MTMKQKLTVTLDQELVAFLDAQAGGNRCDCLNTLLAQQRRQKLEAELIAALQQDGDDPDYQAEVAVWDVVAGDGINAKG